MDIATLYSNGKKYSIYKSCSTAIGIPMLIL